MIRELSNIRRRSALAVLAVGIVMISGSAAATSASAASASAATSAGTPAIGQQHENVIAPSYYVTTSGKRLSAAEVAANRKSVSASEALPVYYISPGEAGDLEDAHTCVQTGIAGGVQGVECADVFALGTPTNVSVYAAGEGYCQTSDGYLQCPAIKFEAQLAYAPLPGVAYTLPVGTEYCGGHSTPACNSSGRNFFTVTNSVYAPLGCDERPGHGNEFWTIVLPQTIVALPGGVNTSHNGNLGSNHVIVCFSG